MRPIRLAALGLAMALAACSSGNDTPTVKLDGSPRIASVEGVVVKASKSGITLDGNRTYAVDRHLMSFSTYNRKVVALKTTIGRYVQLGLKDKTATWLALIGIVSTDNNGNETVVYQGLLTKIVGRRFEFKDGTVLTLANGLTPPANPYGDTYAVINPKTHVIQGATFQGTPPATTTSTTKAAK